MKKYIYFSLFIFSLLLGACSPEAEDIFGENAANRIEERLAADKAVLVSAQNGWLMEYYPAAGQIYGGYNVLALFKEDGSVTVSADIMRDGTAKETSTYRMKEQAGPTLTFDTHNSIFHIFSDPKNDLGIGSDGKGMEGDYEFTIMEATAEKVILKGKKTGNKIVMTPFTGDWNEYLDGIIQMNQNLSTIPQFSYADGDFEATVIHSYHTLEITYKEGEDDKDITVPYIVTATGLKFMEPLKLNGKSIETLEYQTVGDVQQLVSGNIVLTSKFPLSYYLLNGDWYFSYKNIGEYGKPYWETVYKKALIPNDIQLIFAAFTPYSATQTAFYWETSGAVPGAGLLIFNTKSTNDNEVRIEFAASGAGTGVMFYQQLGWNLMIEPFSKGAGVTFTLTADDEKNPSVITMTDTSNKKNVIKVFKEEILDPFNN